ncbi:MAG: right-handed parallel beta-helix repeat-containing protein, partial [Clostridiales bacterium]|jgi:hypothetical protein|nr:right-handed parallel beta-helix repeat-containing protein [Clostridiales bacterium]
MKLLYTRTVTAATQHGTQFDLEVDANLPTSPAITGALVANASRIPRMTVENCLIRNKRNRGILAQVQNSEIKNCAFQNVLHGAVSMVSAKDVFSEGTVPRDVRVYNCKFLSNSESDIVAARSGGTIVADTLSDIKAFNNFFYGGKGYGVYYYAAGGGEIRNNLSYNGAARAAIYVRTSEGVTVKDNYAYRDSPLEGWCVFNNADSTGTIESNNVFDVKGE